jgi:hypothetical protein
MPGGGIWVAGGAFLSIGHVLSVMDNKGLRGGGGLKVRGGKLRCRR